MFTYSASFEVYYIHLTRDRYTSFLEANKDYLPKPETISQIGTFVDEDADTDYYELMDILYK